ncbi:hypothetical protein [Candidatus Clostridium helianthi]|uniref:Uncharacterized protein n=1 Tax=Candidatus Clostridium helianthi TaxID=3381660 RepID=A0ABW8SBC2_9CLOT
MSYKKALEQVLINLRCIDITENDQVESYVDDSIRIIKKVLESTSPKDYGFEPSISKREYEMRVLKEACAPVANYLKKNHDQHCAVIITDSQIRLVRDEIGIPVETAQEVPVQEQQNEKERALNYLAISSSESDHNFQ